MPPGRRADEAILQHGSASAALLEAAAPRGNHSVTEASAQHVVKMERVAYRLRKMLEVVDEVDAITAVRIDEALQAALGWLERVERP